MAITTKICVLVLNDMRSGQIENLKPVAWSESRDRLVEYVRAERCEPYREPYGPDQLWGKSFKKDGPLEWFNPPIQFGGSVGGFMELAVVLVNGIPHAAVFNEPVTHVRADDAGTNTETP